MHSVNLVNLKTFVIESYTNVYYKIDLICLQIFVNKCKIAMLHNLIWRNSLVTLSTVISRINLFHINLNWFGWWNCVITFIWFIRFLVNIVLPVVVSFVEVINSSLKSISGDVNCLVWFVVVDNVQRIVGQTRGNVWCFRTWYQICGYFANVVLLLGLSFK